VIGAEEWTNGVAFNPLAVVLALVVLVAMVAVMFYVLPALMSSGTVNVNIRG
jgi:hypothetical protein